MTTSQATRNYWIETILNQQEDRLSAPQFDELHAVLYEMRDDNEKLWRARQEIIEQRDALRAQLDAARDAHVVWFIDPGICPRCGAELIDGQIFCDDCAFMPDDAPNAEQHMIGMGAGVMG